MAYIDDIESITQVSGLPQDGPVDDCYKISEKWGSSSDSRQEAEATSKASFKTSAKNRPYPIEQTAEEFKRLDLQSRWYGYATRRLLSSVELSTGMTVLDIGTGTGELALRAAQIVGKSGYVLGIDQDQFAIRYAQDKAEKCKVSNVKFETQDVLNFSHIHKFDLVIGQLVLWCQSDKVKFIRQCALLVKPGGKLAFLEEDMSKAFAFSNPRLQSYDELMMLLGEITECCGFPLTMGGKLKDLFVKAGLSEPSVFNEIPFDVGGSLAIEIALSNLRALLPHANAASLEKLRKITDSVTCSGLSNVCATSERRLFGIPLVGAFVNQSSP